MSSAMRATFKFGVERQGKRKVIEVRRPARAAPAGAAVHPVARRLALAYYVERCVEAGVVAGYAEAARRLGITRARMAQVMDLLLLPLEAQEGILLGRLEPVKAEVREMLASGFPPPSH